MNTIEKNIELIANWWAAQLSGRGAKWNNGDAKTSAIANILLEGLRSNPEEDKVRAFKEALIGRMEAEHKANGWLSTLRVDYSPMGILGEAAKEAGLNPFAFPCKTYTKIVDGKPYASCGYGKPLTEITESQFQEQ